jgi:hypothetical protein
MRLVAQSRMGGPWGPHGEFLAMMCHALIIIIYLLMLDRSIITSRGGGNVYIYLSVCPGADGRAWIWGEHGSALVGSSFKGGFRFWTAGPRVWIRVKKDNYQVGCQFWEVGHARSRQEPREEDVYDILNKAYS